MQTSLFDLSGKSVLITGSTKGIGRAMAEEMAYHGANVVISSRKSDACEAVANAINSKLAENNNGSSNTAGNMATNKAVAVPANIGHKDQLENLVAKSREAFGKIDVLVCNAAVNPYYGPMKDMPDDAFDKILSVNIKSNHWLAHMVMPEMIERNDGAIIIVSSVGGLRGHATLGGYCISKAADLQLVRNLATEYGPNNIRVNAISPGLIKTDFARALWENPETLSKRTEGDPLRRIGEPREVAGAAVFLASKAGSFTTGQNFVIDGGATIS
jgi:NAD(P)-dependent dehydrogenase (short-subunit alcohol dehydrogenase family)